jgi:hypothetical protein
MIPVQNYILGIGVNPVDNSSTTTTGPAFDTRANGGISQATCIVSLGNVAATMTTLKLEMSNDNSAWVDVTGGGFTAPTLTTGDNTLRCAFVNLGNSTIRRYLRVNAVSPAGACLISAVWIGTRVGQSPNTATERGVAEQLFI